MLLENGPYRFPTVHDKMHPPGAPSPPATRHFRASTGGALPKLVRNDYAWSSHHHMLYVEQPAESKLRACAILYVSNLISPVH